MEYLYGTLHVAVDMDITEIHRVCLSQNGTHYAEMYYPDYTDDEIQKMQDLEQAELDKAFELGQQAAQPEPQWIPCSITPPELGVDGNVLLYGKDGNYAVGWYNGCYRSWDVRFDMETPVAWMPIEPWRGEEQ